MCSTAPGSDADVEPKLTSFTKQLNYTSKVASCISKQTKNHRKRNRHQDTVKAFHYILLRHERDRQYSVIKRTAYKNVSRIWRSNRFRSCGGACRTAVHFQDRRKNSTRLRLCLFRRRGCRRLSLRARFGRRQLCLSAQWRRCRLSQTCARQHQHQQPCNNASHETICSIWHRHTFYRDRSVSYVQIICRPVAFLITKVRQKSYANIASTDGFI